MLTNVAGVEPSDQEVADHVAAIDDRRSRVALASSAVHHEQPLASDEMYRIISTPS